LRTSLTCRASLADFAAPGAVPWTATGAAEAGSAGGATTVELLSEFEFEEAGGAGGVVAVELLIEVELELELAPAPCCLPCLALPALAPAAPAAFPPFPPFPPLAFAFAALPAPAAFALPLPL